MKRFFFWKRLTKKQRLYFQVGLGALLVVVVPLVVSTLQRPTKSEAAWFNDQWYYRKAIEIATHTASENNVYINLTGANDIDTSDTTKFQADCGDLRFTKQNGELLPYYISSGCGTVDTVVHVQFDTFPSGAQTIYFYYGNPSASNGFSSSDFSTEASNYTFGSQGTEEKSEGPAAYWNFDEGAGTTAYDSTSNKNNGTLSGTTKPTWQAESQCISGKCLFFPGGSSGSVTVANTVSGVQTVSFWVRPASSSASLIDLNPSDASITATSGTVSALNFTSPTIYVNGVVSSTLTPNSWQLVTITTGTGISASAIKLGNVKGDYLQGFIDDVKIYPYARTPAQIKTDYASRGSVKGTSTVMGNKDLSYLSNGLVGWWRMDEATWSGNLNEVVDSSGNGNNGTAQGATSAKAYPGAGKFGNGGVFDGMDDYVRLEDSSTLKGMAGLTISAWIKPTSVSGSYDIIHKEHAYEMTIISGVLKVAEGTQWSFQGGPSISPSVWTHVTMSWDGNILRIFLNGALTNSYSLTKGAIPTNSNWIALGANPVYPGTNNFPGSIDDVRIYNRALTPSEVEGLYQWAPGPIGYWNFEEGQGSTVYDRGASSSASLNNGTWNGTGTTHYTQGKYGWGGKFNGSDDYVNIADPSAETLDPTYGYSVEGWIKYTSTSNYGFIVSKSTNGAGGFELFRQNNAGTLRFSTCDLAGVCSGGYFDITTTGSYADGRWHFVAATAATNSTAKIYVDGVLVKESGTITKDNIATSAPLTIGGRGDHGATNAFNGNIDDVRIYNYARSQKQIVEDMNASHPSIGSPVGSAVGYWKFDEGYGTTANNSGSAGTTLNGTLNNGVWTNNGKFNKALSFDGNDYVSTTITLNNTFTITGWFNPGSFNGSGQVINARNDYIRLQASSNKLNFSVWDTEYKTVSSKTLNTNQWYHFVAIYNHGASIQLYLDGISQGTTSIGNIGGSTNTFYLGARGYIPDYYYNGLIDEVKVYNYALTIDEIKTEYNRGSSMVLGSFSNTSGLTGGSTASNSASALYCVPGDTAACSPPVGEWNFEEKNGGSANDTSGNGNTGTLTLGPTWTTGKIGGALNFDGSNDYVNIPDPAGGELDPTTAYSIEGWVKYTSTTNYGFIISKSNTGAGGYELFRHTGTGQIRFSSCDLAGVCTGGYFDITTTGSYNDGKWHHIAATAATNSTAKIYVDGLLVKESGTITQDNIATSDPLTIGHRGSHGAGFQFAGQIDGVKIFNYVRSPAQIAWDYNRGGPVGWWKFNECQGATAHDSSGNNNNGTITIDATIPQTVLGTCTAPTDGTGAWYNGRTGKLSYSLNFDGIDDWVNISDSSSLQFGTNDFALSAWIKTTTTSNQVFLGKYSGSGNNYYLSVGTGTAGVPQFSITGGALNATGKTVNDGQWHLVTGVRSAGTGYIYIDGVLINSGALDQNSNAGGSLGIARFGSGANYFFNGQLDDVRIYNYALTASQIKTLYNQGSAVRFGPSQGSP